MKRPFKYASFFQLCGLSIIALALGHCAGSKPVPVKAPEAYFEEGMRALERKRCA